MYRPATPPVGGRNIHPTQIPIALCSYDLGQFAGQTTSGSCDRMAQLGPPARRFGPDFHGSVALAARAHHVVVAGRHRPHGVDVFVVGWTELELLGTIDAEVDELFDIVELIWYRQQWHLFGRDRGGRSTHHVSDDAVTWECRTELVRSFPAFVVTGAGAMAGELILAGRVVLDHANHGWGLLAFDGDSFRPRPVPVPLSSQLSVIGPIATDAGDVSLLLDSGSDRTVARSSRPAGSGWTLSLLTPTMVPAGVFEVDGAIWMAGHEAAGGEGAVVARLGGRLLGAADPDGTGAIRKVTSAGGQVIMARERA